jgi:hypothetical protein
MKKRNIFSTSADAVGVKNKPDAGGRNATRNAQGWLVRKENFLHDRLDVTIIGIPERRERADSSPMDLIFTHRQMDSIESTFQMSRMTPAMMVTMTVGTEKEGKGRRRVSPYGLRRK